ncbi:MAG: RyR domain-containing protein [Bacteroidota bacterium]
MAYTPAPLPTDSIVLPSGLDGLVEQLAEHVHDVWAKGRLSEGWTYGPRRDDDAKRHPGLMPYAELSEEEKDYDRRTALEAIKATLLLGYAVTPLAGGSSSEG